VVERAEGKGTTNGGAEKGHHDAGTHVSKDREGDDDRAGAESEGLACPEAIGGALGERASRIRDSLPHRDDRLGDAEDPACSDKGHVSDLARRGSRRSKETPH
jgi:hypothetical protein